VDSLLSPWIHSDEAGVAYVPRGSRGQWPRFLGGRRPFRGRAPNYQYDVPIPIYSLRLLFFLHVIPVSTNGTFSSIFLFYFLHIVIVSLILRISTWFFSQIGYWDNYSFIKMFKNYHFVCLFNILADVQILPRHFLSVFFTERYLQEAHESQSYKKLFFLERAKIMYLKELWKKKSAWSDNIYYT